MWEQLNYITMLEFLSEIERLATVSARYVVVCVQYIQYCENYEQTSLCPTLYI
jgi:hypothetical protein